MTETIRILKKEYDFFKEMFSSFNSEDVDMVILDTYYRRLKEGTDRFYYIYGRLCYLQYFKIKEIHNINYKQFQEIIKEYEQDFIDIEKIENNIFEINDLERTAINRKLDSFPVCDYKTTIKEGIIDGFYFDNLDKLTHNNQYFDKIKYNTQEMAGKSVFEFSEFCQKIEQEINDNYKDAFDLEFYDEKVEKMIIDKLPFISSEAMDLTKEELIQILLISVYAELGYKTDKDLSDTIDSYRNNINIPETMKDEESFEMIETEYLILQQLEVPVKKRVLS